MKHQWGTSSASAVETRVTYDPSSRLRNTEKTQGTAWMSILGRSDESGVHTDYSYTDRYELTSSGKYLLNADWSVGAANTDTARDYAFDPMGNRTSDETGNYTPNELNQYDATPTAAELHYDANGNLTNDGVATYAYDAENRLITMNRVQGAKSRYTYDYLGRRIRKTATGMTTQRYLYDGWNLIAELDDSGTITRQFVWGLDVSGSAQGAGGVGGLLEIDAGGTSQYYPIYDASHNVIGLYSGTGAIAAAYEYDPFGNKQTGLGTYAKDNPFRFSTKYTDPDSGLVYYGMRYYSAKLGRFLNQDPIEEAGGINLYAFCGNDGVNRFDLLGMDGDPFDNLFRTGNPQSEAGSDHPWSTTIWGSNSDTPPNFGSSTSGTQSPVFSYSIGTFDARFRPDGEHWNSDITGPISSWWDNFMAGDASVDPSGKGDIGTYLVRQNAAGEWVIAGKTNGVTTKYAFVNGITGELGRHAYLGGKHLQTRFGKGVTEFTLFNNPTHGALADIWETTMDKLGFTSAPAKALAGVLQAIQASGQSVEWIAHSQGGAIFSEAMRYAGGDLSANSVTFDAGANNHWVTNSIAADVRVNVHGYYYSSWDAVPNVIGFNGNPVSMVGSTLASPLLWTNEDLSPHTLASEHKRW